MCRRHVSVICCTALLLTFGSPLQALSQAPQDAAGSADVQESEEESPPMDQASPEMREMAKAMKSMAEMCEIMMQGEMQARPLMMTAAAVLGSLLSLALLLFVVLEIQWIRFWSLRIKSERKQLNQ